MLIRTLSLVMISAALAACTTLVPGAEEVQVTHDPQAVIGCKPMGTVQSTPPYIAPTDDLKQLKNQAVALGADTVLRTSWRLETEFMPGTRGVAYRCRR